MRMVNVFLTLLLTLFASAASRAQDAKPLLMQQPTLNATHIVFAYGGELWTVRRNGGDAVRLTSGPGQKSNPRFSPDGKWVAFTGQYDGNFNIYVLPAHGGTPHQLTYGIGPDLAEGWTPDGKRVLFRSARDSYSIRVENLYTIPFQGGFAQALPLPMGYQGSFSPEGSRLAYTPLPRELFFVDHGFLEGLVHGFWANYHGGLAPQVWIVDLKDSRVVKVPHQNVSDFNPMWVGNKIYFLSARTEPITLYVYDTITKELAQAIENHGMDIMSASAGPGAIVYEQFGSLHLYDLTSGLEHQVNVNINGDFPEARPHFAKVADHAMNAGISPTGARAVFEAHGEILTVSAASGDVRNITNSPGAADRFPAWSPDGKWIAYFSDDTGEYALQIKSQDGMGSVRTVDLGDPPSFFMQPAWSPDSKKIVYTDKRLNIWYVDLAHPAPVKVDTDAAFVPNQELNPSWSPDSRWITYTKLLSNHMRAVFVYSLVSGQSRQLTDGMSDAENAAFDKGGKYLYFTASVNSGPTMWSMDMTSAILTQAVTRTVCLMLLQKASPSPLSPEREEGTISGTAVLSEPPKPTDSGSEVRIDFDAIDQRILALPIAPANYSDLQAGKSGELFLLQGVPSAGPFSFGSASPTTLIRFSLASRTAFPLASGIQFFKLSFDSEKLLYLQGGKWGITSTEVPIKPAEGLLNLDSMEVWVDPGKEWRQMFHEAWRMERDFFYASNYHGLDLRAAEKEYEPYLAGIASREDLNYLFREMLGKVSVGHMFVGGGDIPKLRGVSVGLLGADYSVENGRYRFSKIYKGESWTPALRAPLTEPGADVRAGNYLLAVNGREVSATDDIYKFFLNIADKHVELRVGPNPDGIGSHEVIVTPVRNEIPLRNYDWIQTNMKKVDQLSGGRIGYVYLPDTGAEGYASFNRYFFAQVGKEGVIVDERFNSGGVVADYLIEYLQRKVWNYWYLPDGPIWTEPGEAIYGPKALLINQYAASGGELLAWWFHKLGIGPLIGERTWGALIGLSICPPLIDGGFVSAPKLAFFTPEKEWGIENHGVSPDVEVETDPHAWRDGRDPQLEKAVELILQELREHPVSKPEVPQFPDYYKH